MAASTLAYVTPEALKWARESTGYSVKEAASKIKIASWRLELAEEGQKLLTLRQAEKAAETYERPLAALFLPEPPDEETIEVQFRRLPGAPELPWQPEMHLLGRRIRHRQDAIRDLMEDLDENPAWPAALAELSATAAPAGPPAPADVAVVARRLLGVTDAAQGQWTDNYEPWRAWRAGLEDLGVFVMQDGSMTTETMRGFASVDPSVPAIVVNSKDDPRTRAYTAVHELGHLLLEAWGAPGGAQAHETWCNEFAGHVLMPVRWLRQIFATVRGPSLRAKVEATARTLSVTPLAAAVRLARTEIAARPSIDQVIDEIQTHDYDGGGEHTGGNYYRNQVANFGPGYIRLVFSALDDDAVSYSVASTLLDGVKVSNFSTLRDTVNDLEDPR